jgi:hypothetical protein
VHTRFVKKCVWVHALHTRFLKACRDTRFCRKNIHGSLVSSKPPKIISAGRACTHLLGVDPQLSDLWKGYLCFKKYGLLIMHWVGPPIEKSQKFRLSFTTTDYRSSSKNKNYVSIFILSLLTTRNSTSC